MQDHVLTAISDAFGDLLREKKYRVVKEVCADTGNAYAVLESEELRLRFVSDRSVPLVDIGVRDRGQDWFELGLVRVLLEGGDLLEPAPLAELAGFLMQNYMAVKAVFAAGQYEVTARALAELAKKRSQAMFGYP